MKASNSDQTPRQIALAFLGERKLTQVVRNHRREGCRINRHDYYEFLNPGTRRLSEEHLSIIARDLGLTPKSVRIDYVERGGEIQVRSRRRTEQRHRSAGAA